MIEIPDEIFRSILGILSLTDASRMIQVSKKSIHLLDGYVMPHCPSMRIRASSGIVKLEKEKLCRITRPGHGVITGIERIDGLTCYWEIELQQFKGLRLEIGVCDKDAITDYGSIDREHIWTFDCAGRIRHGNIVCAYGEKLSTGTSVGVLFRKELQTLTFFRDGICMGTAHCNVKAGVSCRKSGLFPIVIIPSVPGERVSVHGSHKFSLPTLTSSLLATQYKWHMPPMPRTHSLTIESFSPAFNFQLDFPGYTTTVEELKQILSQSEHFRDYSIEAENLMLYSKGAILDNNKFTLEEVGIRFGDNGAQLQDLFIYL